MLPEFREVPVNSNSKKRDVESAASLDKRLDLSFSNLALLIRALTHSSYANENSDAVQDNERLEFLGDAVLDFIVGGWAFKRFPDYEEGKLTKIRATFVSNEQLAVLARRIDLGNALRLGRGEETSGGYDRDNILGSAFEALIGALYLDSGIESVSKFMQPHLEWMKATQLDDVKDPKSELQEITQSMKLGMPQYEVVNSSGPDHAKVYEVEVKVAGEVKGQGSGSSKNAAEQAAAKYALETHYQNYRSSL